MQLHILRAIYYTKLSAVIFKHFLTSYFLTYISALTYLDFSPHLVDCRIASRPDSIQACRYYRCLSDWLRHRHTLRTTWKFCRQTPAETV